MKYKGKSIEYQRVKGKKAPKIQQLDSKDLLEKENQQKFLSQHKPDFFADSSKSYFLIFPAHPFIA